MKKVRLLTIVLTAALLLAAAALSGCANTGDTTEDTDTSATPSSSTLPGTEATSEPVQSTQAATTEQPAESTTEAPQEEEEWVSALFGGGPLVLGGIPTASIIKDSGFNTVILWSVHVNADTGDLYFNDQLVCSDGEYVGTNMWRMGWEALKEGDNAVDRIEISIGAWGTADFENIRSLMQRDGDGEDTILYRNFKALIDVTGADAVNYDDESCYDVDATVAFSEMLLSMGVKITLCPYTNTAFWSSLLDELGSDVDRVYLQCYSGGSGNNPAQWSNVLGTKVIPGYWCLNDENSEGSTAEEVNRYLTRYKVVSEGGFMWYYDDMRGLSSPNSTADYAEAINSVGRDDS